MDERNKTASSTPTVSVEDHNTEDDDYLSMFEQTLISSDEASMEEDYAEMIEKRLYDEEKSEEEEVSPKQTEKPKKKKKKLFRGILTPLIETEMTPEQKERNKEQRLLMKSEIYDKNKEKIKQSRERAEVSAREDFRILQESRSEENWKGDKEVYSQKLVQQRDAKAAAANEHYENRRNASQNSSVYEIAEMMAALCVSTEKSSSNSEKSFEQESRMQSTSKNCM